MESNLLKYIWKHSKSDQLWMLIVILASMPTYFLSLELPKRLVNGPIQGVGFENPDDVGVFLQTSLPFGETLFGREIVLFSGFEMERISFLMALSITFLLLVIANGLFKLYINTFKGRMGERLLRRLRFELFDRVLRYPLSRFRRTRASEVASMIKDEVEPMGAFIGDAFTQPLFLGGQALVALLFIFLQNFWLGVATFVVIMFQAWLIPRLRRRLIELGKQRQISARELSGRLGEVVEGIQEAHTNDTTNYERANISSILGRLFFIRFELFQRKFSVKFINNFLIQFLAFFFYAVGGYLAIRGTLDIGQLIGVIVAYKDLPAPVRGLIDHDQKRLVVETRYAQIIEQFAADDLQDPKSQEVPEEKVLPLASGYEISKLGLTDDSGSTLIDTATADIALGEQVAVIGNFNGGASNFTEVLGRVAIPTRGKVSLGGTPIEELPESVTGRRLAYVDGTTFFPQGTIFDTLTYVLKSQPMVERELTAEERKVYKMELAETRKAGNYDLDFNADWVDYDRAHSKGPDDLYEQVRSVLKLVDIENDIRVFGLRGTLDPATHGELCNQLLEARQKFRERLDELGFSEFVEPFDPDKYNSQSTIGENLLFGTAFDPSFDPENLPENPLIRSVLAEQGLEERLYEMGKQVAATTIELFGDLDPDNPFFDQLSYMDPDDLPAYRTTMGRIADKKLEEISEEDRHLIMRLPFTYTEDRNRLGLLDEKMTTDLLTARKRLHERLEEMEENPVAIFSPDHYNPAASVLDNVLLGRVSESVAEGMERVTHAIRELLGEMGLTDDVFRIGLTYNIGSGGKRLSESQRQKLHLARALMKHPDFLIVNQGMNSLGAREQGALIDQILETSRAGNGHKTGVIWAPVNPAFAEKFGRILVFHNGELVADDSPEALSKSNQTYQDLIS